MLFLISDSLCASCLEIDTSAYTCWQRVDDYSISKNGLWVKYRYVSVGGEKEDMGKCYYFYNTRTGKTKIIKGIEYPEFFANGDWIHYTENNETISSMMNLLTNRKITWGQENTLEYSDESALVNYTRKDGSLVFWRLNSQDSIVYENIGNYRLLDKDRYILYIWKSDDGYELRYGELFNPSRYKVIYHDSECLLKSFNFDDNRGTFELNYTQSLPVGTQMWQFNLDGDVCLVADSRTWELPADLQKRLRYTHMLGNGVLWELDVLPENSKMKKDIPSKHKDTSFELELWSWTDPVIQSVQNKSGYRKPKMKSDKYVYNTLTQKVVKVCGGLYSGVRYQPGNEPRFVLLNDNSIFQKRKDWQYIERKDFWLLNLQTGEKYCFAKEQTKQAVWSPDGKYVVFYDDIKKAWFRINPDNFLKENISAAIGYPVHNEQNDYPIPAAPYGLVGWSNDNRFAYLYDRFDIWRVDMNDLSQPVCITSGWGRKKGIVLRFFNVHSSERLKIDESKPLSLEMLELKTRNEGIGQISRNGQVKKDYFGPFALQARDISGDGHKIVYVRQSFEEGCNVWVYDVQAHEMKKISDVNPNHNGFPWGKVKMVEWTNGAGKQNLGLLYLPYGFDATKKYPVIVDYYETHAQEMHMSMIPGLSSALLDIPTFLSHGYIIFRPDVYFTLGEPAQSVYNAVVSGVKYLINEGIADPNHIGIQGHSWSGCTVSQLITMTDLFCCANINAGVVNLVEAYTALRIGSGETRMVMYEDWQCRMGKNLWDAKDAYIRNSSILNADKINIPVLIMHNDQDEAVEYHEGRNLFLALRRLQKPVWLLNYKGEGHFIDNIDAQFDWSLRMMQFFNHYLKDAPAPRWMVEGININERGFDRKYELILTN